MNRVWIYLGIGIAALAALIIWLAGERPEALEDRDGQIRIVHALLLLVLVGSALMVRRNLPSGWVLLKGAIAWILFGLLLILGYSYKEDISRLWSRTLAEIMPGRAIDSGGEVIIRSNNPRQFVIEAVVDGARVNFLLDTGATTVALTPNDARAIGFDLQSLSYSRWVGTANGPTQAAPVTLKEIRIGGITVRNVEAVVLSQNLRQSLLGISYLEKLRSYSIEGQILTLRK